MRHALLSLPDRAHLPPPPTGLSARFAIAVDVPRSLVRYTLSGFFDPATIAAFKVEQAAALRTLRCAPNQHVTSLDISGCRIQSREILAQFAAMLADRRYRSCALAVVVGGSLARMQVGRILARAEVGYFTTVVEAEAWLSAEGLGSAPDRVGD